MHLKMDKIGGLAIISFIAGSSVIGLIGSAGVAAEVSTTSVQSYAGSGRPSGTNTKVKIIDNDDQDSTENAGAPQDSANTITWCGQAKKDMDTGKAEYIDRAVVTLQKVIAAEPKSVLANRLYVQALILKHKPKEADAVLRSLQQMTGKPEAIDYLSWGDIYLIENQLPAAFEQYKTSFQMDRTLPQAEIGMIRTEYLQHRIDDALLECNRAIQNFPKMNKYLLQLHKYLVAYKNQNVDANAGAASSLPPVAPPVSPDVYDVNKEHTGGG